MMQHHRGILADSIKYGTLHVSAEVLSADAQVSIEQKEMCLTLPQYQHHQIHLNYVAIMPPPFILLGCMTTPSDVN